MAATQSGIDQTVALVFSVIDADGSKTIDGHELLQVLSAMSYSPTPALLQHLSDNCKDMTQDDMKRLLNTTAASAGSKERANLGMLCGAVPGLESLVVVRESIDAALGSNPHLREALKGWGFAPEGTLSPSERTRLYAALWNNVTGGAWAIEVKFLETRFRNILTAYLGRIHRAAAMTVFDGAAESFDQAASEVTHRLQGRDSQVFTTRGMADATSAGLKDEVARLSMLRVPFPCFADALESMVQYADSHTGRTPGSLLLWRLYCVVRVCEGFPVGAPHAVSATSGFGLVSDSAASALAGSEDRMAGASSRPILSSDERYLVELGPKATDGSDGAVRGIDTFNCPSSEARRLAEDVSTTGITTSDDPEIQDLIAQPGAVEALVACREPSWTDLRWSSATARPVPTSVANGASMAVSRRAWWSPGAARILDLFVDEEDAARLAGMTAAYARVAPVLAGETLPPAMGPFSDEARELAVGICLLDGEGGPLRRSALRRAAASEHGLGAGHHARRAPVGAVAGRVQARLLSWLSRFHSRVSLDPTGEAAVARWLVTVLSDEQWETETGKGGKGLGASPDLLRSMREEAHFALGEPGDRTAAEAHAAKSWGLHASRATTSVLEVGGPALLTQLMGMWYRVNLEVASAATAVDVGRRRRHGATGRAHEEAGDTCAVAGRFQVPFPAAAAHDTEGAAPGHHDDDDVHSLSFEHDLAAPASASAAGSPRSVSTSTLPLERLCVVTEGAPDPSARSSIDLRQTSLTWTRATEVAWRVMRDDTLYAAYSACFPPPLLARLGARPTRNDVAAVHGKHVEASPHGDDGEDDDEGSITLLTAWDGTSMPMHGALHASHPPSEAEASDVGAGASADWDGDDPFDEAALWRADKPKAEGSDTPTTLTTAADLVDAARRRGRGRVTVMRWLVHASDEATHVRLCGAQAREEGLLAPYDPAEAGAADDWASAVAVGVWAQVRKAAQLRADISSPGSNLAGLLHTGGPSQGFVADVMAATQLPETRSDWQRASPELVEAWARGIVGRREDGSPDPHFAVGPDTLLALAVWRDVERRVPANAGALTDLEPMPPPPPHKGASLPPPGTVLGGPPHEDLAWLTPARAMAVLVALSQSRSQRVRRWALVAKRILAEVKFATEPRRTRLAGLTPPAAASICDQSAVWHALYRHRDTLAPMRMSVSDWADLPAAGVDSLPGAEVDRFEGSSFLFGRCLRLTGWSCQRLVEQLRTARTGEA